MEEIIKEYVNKLGLLLKQIDADELIQNGDVVIGKKIDGVWDGPMVTYFLRGDKGDYEMIVEIRGVDEKLLKMLAVDEGDYLGVLMINKVVGVEVETAIGEMKTYYLIGEERIVKRVSGSGEKLSGYKLVNSFGNNEIYDMKIGEEDLSVMDKVMWVK